jgi:hypothetical protein
MKSLRMLSYHTDQGSIYIGKHPPTPQRKGKNISRCHLKRKNMKKGREKGGKCNRKGRKGKEKGTKG